MSKYKRILLKLSGEALQGDDASGINPSILQSYCEQIKEINAMGIEVGIVIGGGNIFRGLSGSKAGYDRVKGDYMGMLATVINGLGIQSALESIDVPAKVFTAIEMGPVSERFKKSDVMSALKKGTVAIFTFGTGNPYFTTDSAAALRGIETECDVLLKGTRVDGIYTADPEKDSSATRYDTLSFDEVYQKGLKIMDLTAFTLCKENNLPIIVFDMNQTGTLKQLILGEKVGTVVKN